MESFPFATVVVCTQNRSRSLAFACESTLAMDYPADRWRLVIVDNASTDDTLAIAEELARRHRPRVEVIVEEEIGISAARNAGVRAAVRQGAEVVAFLDDDALPSPGWLTMVARALSSPGVEAVGGPIEPLFEVELPSWFLDRYLPYLTIWDPGPEAVELTYNEYPRGANMAFRTGAFQRWGLFSTHLGRKGTSLLSGEEVELCLRLERGGGRVHYVPEARVRHRVDAGRLTPGWITRRFGAQGRSEAIIDWCHGGAAGLGRGLRQAIGNVLSTRRHRHRFEGGELLARCQTFALGGYLDGALRALATVRRYRAAGAAPWPGARRNGSPTPPRRPAAAPLPGAGEG